jgi:hypothetical protein
METKNTKITASKFGRAEPFYRVTAHKESRPELVVASAFLLTIKEKKKKIKDSAGSEDTASMIKGGGYLGACTRQPPTAQTNEKKLMWVRGVVCRSTWTQSLTFNHSLVLVLLCSYKLKLDACMVETWSCRLKQASPGWS